MDRSSLTHRWALHDGHPDEIAIRLNARSAREPHVKSLALWSMQPLWYGKAIVADGGMSNSMGFRHIPRLAAGRHTERSVCWRRLVKKKRAVKNKFEAGMSRGK